MRRLLKILGVVLLVIIGVGATGFVFVNSGDIPSYDVQTVAFNASHSPEAIARGEKLVTMLCANCHIDRKTGKLTGTRMLDAPPEFGEIHSPNITGDPTYGIGQWTDGELVYLLRTGIKKDGKYAPPYMAKLPHLADVDMDAIISFLRSDHKLVAADATPDVPTKPAFLTKLLCKIAWKPFPMPTEVIHVPPITDELATGKYLAHNLDCFSCHSADFKTNNYLEPEKSPGYFAGGNMPLDLQGRVMYTSNLTPDKATGIGNWSKDQFIRTVKYGEKEGETALVYPMMPYTQLTDAEVGAIFSYLQTIPAIENLVERSVYD